MGPVLYLYAVFLLFGFNVVSTCPDGDCRELAFPEFSFFAHKRLVNHFIKTLQVNDFDMCQLRCYQDPNCVSINFNFNQDSQANNNCELNNATHENHENELHAKTGYAYHGTLNACDKAYCANEGTCQSGFTDKGYRCLCRLGLTSAHCEQDIDECSTGNHNCSHVAECKNTFGSYNCTCKKGYAGDGRNCTDIDECSTGKHNCSHVAACNNTIGSYHCTCKEGYVGDGRNCSDIDECSTREHNCSHVAVCNNTIGSYNCTCQKGFVGDGRKCSENLGIDECKKLSCDVNADCDHNTDGSYICTCKAGYTGDGKTCTDIDECSTGKHNCSHVAVCKNTIGSYNCTCKEGYVGDGRNCSGCPKDWVANGKYCYKLGSDTDRPRKLQVARQQCQKMSAQLPIIQSEQENTFIAKTMLTPKKSWVWLSMERDGGSGGKLLWFDGVSAEKTDKERYNAWASSHPDGENCATISFAGPAKDPKWESSPCDYPDFPDVVPPFYLCQKSRL